VHSYSVIPSNIPFVIQRDVLVYEQSDRRHDSLQTYITAVDTGYTWISFTLKCIGVFCGISEYNRKKQSTEGTTGELLADKVVRAF